jgi:hypothetical protein
LTKWEYCVVDLDAGEPAAHLLTLEGARQLYTAGAHGDGQSPSALIALLGDEGWELTTSTTEVIGDSSFGLQPHVTRLRSNRVLYFKRPNTQD